MALTKSLDDKEQDEPMHIDQFIEFGSSFTEDSPENEKYARWVIHHFRLSAIMKWAFDEFMNEHKLFCTFENEKYRVTGASRLGDVWLTKDFKQKTGYQKRVMIGDCSEWAKDV